MDERFKKLNELFLAVCDLDTQQRKAILDRECAGDAELRAEVESLLEHHEEPATTTVQQTARRRVPGSDAEPGEHVLHIGPYRVIQEIGRGGMGVVYLGVREGDRFRRRIAVKLLKRGMDTDEILGRFERERQVLGALNHPGIARLYEAGQTEDGLPYFAMEYIEGQPIDDYCDTHRLRIAERLALFRQVCAAVHYVHQNLMVHRDLKPSNVLVTGDGVPKLLDFGIAKLTNPEMSLVGGDPTSLERRLMTPEYASPEQVRGNPVGVASDIYSLGVILYELLTGHRPYHISSRVRAEIERVICDVDPERPSTAASGVEVIADDEHESGMSTTITPEVVAKVREGRPDRLRRRLAGDIDNMVLMAMRKEPQRRYRSADQFAEDIHRHLEGLPVVARHDTAGYRFAKFVRRHRRAVAAAAVFVVALMGWGVTAAYGWTAEARHSRAVEAQRDRTRVVLEQFFDLTHAFYDFQTKIARLDGSLPARKQLAQTAQECLEGLRPDVGDDPQLLRELAAAYAGVGDIWGGHRGESFGETAVALENYRTALAVRSDLLAKDPGDPELQYEVAVCHLRIGDVLRFSGDVDGALEGYRTYLRIVEAQPREHPRFRRRLAFALGTVGSSLKDKGRLKEAHDYYERSLAVRQGELAERPDDAQAIRDVGVGYVHVGEALTLLGNREGALKMYLESIALREKQVREDPDNSWNRRYLALSHYFAADMLLKLDRPDDAAAHVNAAVPIFEQRAKDNPTSARAPRQGLAMAREIQGRLQAALGDQEGALESYRRYQVLVAALWELNPDNTFHRGMLADSHERIGDVRREMGDLPAAVWAYRQAHDIVRPAADADPSDVDLQIQLGSILSALGGLLIENDDLLEAQSRLADARSIQESVLDVSPEHARARDGLVLTLRRFSRWAVDRGYPKEALVYAQEAMRIAGRRDAAVLRDLAAALALNGDAEQAAAAAQEAVDLVAGSTGPAAAALREALRQDLALYFRSSENR